MRRLHVDDRLERVLEAGGFLFLMMILLFFVVVEGTSDGLSEGVYSRSKETGDKEAFSMIISSWKTMHNGSSCT